MCKLKILLFLLVFAINVPFGIASYCPTAPTFVESKDMICGIEINGIENIVCVNDDIITFTIFATYTDVGSQGFTITDNQGGVSTHAYSELPLDYEMIGNISSTQELSFTICDIQNPTCCSFYEFANPCFPCNLTGLEVTATCQPGSNLFDLSLYFFETNASTKFYTYINGQQYGPFFYSQLPITISNVVSDCNAEYIVRVEDFVETTCSQQTTIEEICCVPCQITSLMASSVICEQGDIVEVIFDLNYEGNGGENFTVVDNLGNVYEFAYADLPVTVSLPAGNVAQNLGFQVCDQALLGCCLYYEFANPCYDPPVCGMSNIVVTPTCQAGTNDFYAILNFDHQYTSNTFEATINGTGYGTFNYADLPITLFGLEGDCITNYIVNIHDSDFSNCSESVTIPVQCCTIPDTCNIEIINLSGIICSDGDIATVTFDLDHDDTGTEFIVTDDYGNTSTFTYAQLPVTTTVTAATFEAFIGFQVCDIGSPNCCDYIEFANPCYVLPACELTNMTVVPTCTEGGDETFDVAVDIDYLNTSDSFQLSINGSAGSTYGYTQLPLTIANLSADCETNYQFVITDNEMSCTQFVDIGQVCCSSEPCVMDIASVTNISCIGGDSLTIILDLSYSGTDTVGFTVFDFMGNLTFYTYDQLPVSLSIHAPIDVASVSFMVCDFSTPGCCEIHNLANPCYTEPVCSLEIVDLSDIACTNGDIASVTFDLDYEAVGMTGFRVTDDYGNSSDYTYAQLPITTSIIAPINEQLVGFQVCDIDNPNCCDYKEFINPCYAVPPPTGNRVITANVNILRTEYTFAFDIDVLHTLEDDCTFDVSVDGQKMITMHKLDSKALLGTFECDNVAESYHIEFFSYCINEVVWDTIIPHSSTLCETSSNTENDFQSFGLQYDHQSQQVIITNPEAHALTTQIVDIYGRKIHAEQSAKISWTTSIQGFRPGVYIMTAVDKLTHQKSSIKLVVLR